MKSKTTTIFLLFVTVGSLLSAWKIEAESRLKQANWLIGTWEASSASGTTYENWTSVSANEFAGKSFMLNGKDTFVHETIQLLEKENGMYFISKVKEQNSGKAVSFTLKTISENEFVFENLKHDYPQTISYKRTSDKNLVAEISGKVGGKQRKQTFPMKKVN